MVELQAQRAAVPVTAVQDCVSTFLSVTPVDILKEAAGHLPVMSVAKKIQFWGEVWKIPAVFVASKSRSFRNPNRVFFAIFYRAKVMMCCFCP